MSCDSPRIAACFALESDKQRVARRDEIVFFHRSGERVAEGFDDPGIVRPGGVVECEALPAVTVKNGNRGFDSVDTKAGKRKPVICGYLHVRMYEASLEDLYYLYRSHKLV